MTLTPHMQEILAVVLAESRRLEAAGDRPPAGMEHERWRELCRERQEYQAFGVRHDLAQWLGAPGVAVGFRRIQPSTAEHGGDGPRAARQPLGRQQDDPRTIDRQRPGGGRTPRQGTGRIRGGAPVGPGPTVAHGAP